MRVLPIPILADNYAYLISDSYGDAVVVDPAQPDKVLHRTLQNRASLAAVLTTHHHRDHAGGNRTFAETLPAVEIVGGCRRSVPAVTKAVAHGERLQFGRLEVTCLHTPYHTQTHVCYLIRESGIQGPAALFSGDALFVGGCGRRFEGTPEQMHHSLARVLAALPPDTLLYCGHEYTVANLEFAATVDGSNRALLEKLEWAKQQRAKGLPTVPSTIGEELQYNPFLRCHEPVVQQHCGTYPAGGNSSSNSSGTGGSAAIQAGSVAASCTAAAGPGAASEQAAAAGSADTGADAGAGASALAVLDEAAAAGAAGAAPEAAQSSEEDELVIRTLAELRRRKDGHGIMAKLVTAAVTVGAWVGWAP